MREKKRTIEFIICFLLLIGVIVFRIVCHSETNPRRAPPEAVPQEQIQGQPAEEYLGKI